MIRIISKEKPESVGVDGLGSGVEGAWAGELFKTSRNPRLGTASNSNVAISMSLEKRVEAPELTMCRADC